MPTVDFETVKLGVCDVFWQEGGEGAEVHLGLTKGGVTLRYEQSWHDITVDQYGETPIDSMLIGERVTVTVPLAETDLEKLKMLTHTNRPLYEGGVLKKITFGQRPGLRAQAVAGRLRLHPIDMGMDPSNDVVIYKAVNKGALELAYRVNEERVYSCEFTGLIDRRKGDGGLLFEIGDSSYATPVQKVIVAFWISPPNPTVEQGQTIQFTANAIYDDGTTADVTAQAQWRSSDEDVLAPEPQPGLFRASTTKVGTATVSATIGTAVAQTTVFVI